ncbi:Reticulon-4-interacting protein 1-like, mitochondrial [Symbiodinium microadriaticum]|uniref:Reticulon-4-interacting protein 1-like, mitochondrial n=1 Tax=Symbiodinium microadriaticum TaxID=2951 RepID=A0A1Q9E4H1_SYMMI|nr:Reticulon-4-interacting protein 1-like, mitochondrial [Symbiodinium microadriaticum]
MKALQIDGYCDRASAKLREVEKPVADATGVVCKVVATSINPLDWLFRNGVLADLIPVQFPHIIGWDFSGVVDSVGESVTDFKVGDKVYCRPEVTRNGSHAEYILVPEDHLAHMPKTISFSDAASVPIASITAWRALYDLGELREGDKVLIHAGAGSLGIMAIQLAKLKGAHVIATASAEKHPFVKSLGADVVIDYRTTAFEEVLRDLDVVLDTVGGETQARSWQTLKQGGRLVAVNEPINASKAAEYPKVIGRFLSIKPNKEILTQMSRLLDEGKIRTVVGYEFPFRDIQEAFALSESKTAQGKIVIQVGRYTGTINLAWMCRERVVKDGKKEEAAAPEPSQPSKPRAKFATWTQEAEGQWTRLDLRLNCGLCAQGGSTLLDHDFNRTQWWLQFEMTGMPFSMLVRFMGSYKYDRYEGSNSIDSHLGPLKALRSDPDIVLAAIRQNGLALQPPGWVKKAPGRN